MSTGSENPEVKKNGSVGKFSSEKPEVKKVEMSTGSKKSEVKWQPDFHFGG